MNSKFLKALIVGTGLYLFAQEANAQSTCGMPAPGATIASPSMLCLGYSTTLSVTTAPSGTGNAFQWQSSSDNVAYTNIPGATTASYEITPIAPTWFRCQVTCAKGPVTATSTPVQVNFFAAAPSATNGTRCGIGTVDLAASAPSGTLRWYTAASLGAPVDTGSTFTTPVLSSTTTYYVSAETASAGSATIGAGASTTVSSGTSADFISPFDYEYGGMKSQYLFRASELMDAGFGPGDITSISFNVSSGGTLFKGFKVSMGTTTLNALTTKVISDLTTVYATTSPAGYTTPASGTATITFTTPFFWDGGSNLVLDICWSNNNTGGTGTKVKYDATSFVSHSYYREDKRTPDEMCAAVSMNKTVSKRPKITFDGTIVCSTPRTAVTATVNPAPTFTITGRQTVCNNGIATLSVTSSLSSYTDYTWSPASGLYTDAAAMVPYTPGASAATVYARTGTAGAITYTSKAYDAGSRCEATTTTTVTTLPASVTAIAASGVCVSGSANLNLKPSPSGFGAATFQWAVSSDNAGFADIASATDNVYTTPEISETKYYRVAIRNSAGALCLHSVSDTVRVINPKVTATKGASRCGPGTLELSASGTDGTLTWYNAAGKPLDTGTVFTTPSLSSSTTYYVGVEGEGTPGVIQVGSGAATTVSSGPKTDAVSPFDHNYGGFRGQYLFRAGELRALGLTAGDITDVSFVIASAGSTPFEGFRLSIGTTASTTMTSAPELGLTEVYTNLSGLELTSALLSIPFSTPFYWDGTSNLVIQTCWSNRNSGGTGGSVRADATSFAAMNYYRADGKLPGEICGSTTGSGTRNARPVVFFHGTLSCSSDFTAVKATVNAVPVATINPAAGPVDICDGDTVILTGGGGSTYQWINAAGLIAGATSDTYPAAATGDYRVVVTSAAGCTDSSKEISVIVHEKPVVSILPSTALSICADSSQKYTSLVSSGPLTYQWYNAGVAIPGATADTFTASDAGLYSLRVFLASCSDTSNEATLKINPLPASDFTKTGSTGAICLDDSLELTAIAVPAGYAYQWLFNGSDIPGATRRKYYAQTGGDYSVRIRDVNNCRKESDPQLITSTPMGIPDLSPKDVLFCDGNTIMLYANAGPYAAAYRWTKDTAPLPDTTPSIVTGAGGSYDVTVTDVYGCVATSAKVSVTVVPLPAKPVITYAGSSLSVSGTYSSYQWYRNGKVIPGATKKTLTISFDGDYHVVVSNSSDCYSTSDILKLQNLSVSDIHPAVQIKIYPNPAQSMVYIDAPIPVNLLVRDAQGRRLAELEDAKAVDVSGYADGIYLLTFSDAEGQILGTRQIIRKTE